MDQNYFAPFKLPFLFLKKLGMWQEKDSSWSYRFKGLLLHLIFIEFAAICLTVHFVKIIGLGSVKDINEVMSLLFTLYALILKSLVFLVKFQKFKEMLSSLKSLLEFPVITVETKREKLVKNVKWISKVIKALVIFGFLLVTTSNVIMMITSYKSRRLTYETWFPFNHKGNIFLHFSCVIYQYLMAVYASTLNYTFDIILVIFINFTSVMLEELSAEIECFSEDAENLPKCSKSSVNVDRDMYCRKMLKSFVECHVNIKSFAKDISSHQSYAFLIQASMSSIILCATAFMLTSVIILC